MAKVVTLGEIMLRLGTINDQRLLESHQLSVGFGGGEANIAIALANFGHEASYATKVPDNPWGQAARCHLAKYGVDTSQMIVGGERIATYFLEMGTGVRPTNVVFDRKYSAFSEMQELEWDLDELFAGADLFHVSGITPALSPVWRKMLVSLMQEAGTRGVKVSFDINYRGKLWSVMECREAVQELAKYADYLSASALDAIHFFEVPEKTGGDLDYYYGEISKLLPKVEVLYATKREVLHVSHNRLQGQLFMGGRLYTSKVQDIQQIVDRVGGGDAFAAGVLHGLLLEHQPQRIIDFATMAAALKHTVHGDHNQFSAAEVEKLLESGAGDVQR